MEKTTAEFSEGMSKFKYSDDIVKIIKGLRLEVKSNIKRISSTSVSIALLHLCLPSVTNGKGFQLSNYDIALT